MKHAVNPAETNTQGTTIGRFLPSSPHSAPVSLFWAASLFLVSAASTSLFRPTSLLIGIRGNIKYPVVLYRGRLRKANIHWLKARLSV